MSIEADLNVLGLGPTPDYSPTFSNSQLDSNDFLQLMIQELVNQDPLNPMKNNELMTQVSQIKNMETLSRLDETLSGMTLQQGVATAGSLIGKEVSGVSTLHENVTGVVAKVTVGSKTGVVLVTESGDEISLSGLSEIREAA